MAYKILINSKGVPVLVEIHEPDRKLWFRSEATPADNIAALKKLTSESLSTALADESKHIAFKDEKSVWILMKKLMIVRGGNLIGQTFDLPEHIGVSFDWSPCENDICLCTYFEKSECGYTRKLAILTPQAKEDKPVSEGGWISVKERLPDDYSLVLINLTSGAITVGRRLRTNNWAVFTSSGMDCESMTNNVEFWMPLPPPPAKN